MRSVALAVIAAVAFIYACSSEVDMYPVATQSNTPAGRANTSPTSPDAGHRDGGTVGDGGAIGDGGLSDGRGGFDAMPTAFDAGAPTDVGSPAADAGVPPNP